MICPICKTDLPVVVVPDMLERFGGCGCGRMWRWALPFSRYTRDLIAFDDPEFIVEGVIGPHRRIYQVRIRGADATLRVHLFKGHVAVPYAAEFMRRREWMASR